jgi:hypothetical protein
VAALCLAALGLAGCGGAPQVSGEASGAAAAQPTRSSRTAEGGTTQTATTEPVAPPEPTAEPQPPSPDELAGVRSRAVLPRGAGGTVVVPGSVPAPGPGEEQRVRVEVEGGLDVDGAAFAGFVMATLNDPRSWVHDGLAFSRTDGEADVVVVLASPETSAAMCAPMVTRGRLSCRQGPRAIITMYRWVNGTQDYGGDLTGYRHYVLNHEVGHVLGHGHVACPATGAPAPVMQQQTLDVDPCVPNAWPYP